MSEPSAAQTPGPETTPPPSAAAEASDPAATESRSTPVELLWDLVFVFAVTQVTTLFAASMTWSGFGRSMLILALVWWAWSAFVWAANAQGESSPALRVVLLPATAFILVVGLALPRAFGAEGALFAICYAVVRLLHLALYADASHRGNASWAAIAGFAITVAIGMVLLMVGAFLPELPRAVAWIAAVAIDYAGPAWLTRDRLRELQAVAVAHFAERYGLFVIICLGESIVSVGSAALSGRGGLGQALDAGRVLAVVLALSITIALWWIYFEHTAAEAEQRLRTHHDPVLAAADGYSYLHLPLVAGIIIFAAAARTLAHGHLGVSLPGAARAALCGGVALYLAAQLGFSARLGGTGGPWRRLLAVTALVVLWAVGGMLAAWLLTALVLAVLLATCAGDALLEA